MRSGNAPSPTAITLDVCTDIFLHDYCFKPENIRYTRPAWTVCTTLRIKRSDGSHRHNVTTSDPWQGPGNIYNNGSYHTQQNLLGIGWGRGCLLLRRSRVRVPVWYLLVKGESFYQNDKVVAVKVKPVKGLGFLRVLFVLCMYITITGPSSSISPCAFKGLTCKGSLTSSSFRQTLTCNFFYSICPSCAHGCKTAVLPPQTEP